MHPGQRVTVEAAGRGLALSPACGVVGAVRDARRAQELLRPFGGAHRIGPAESECVDARVICLARLLVQLHVLRLALHGGVGAVPGGGLARLGRAGGGVRGHELARPGARAERGRHAARDGAVLTPRSGHAGRAVVVQLGHPARARRGHDARGVGV